MNGSNGEKRGVFLSMDKEEKVIVTEEPAAAAAPPPEAAARRGRRTSSGRETTNRRPADERPREQSDWEEKIIQVRRVTKVVKGGKKLSFRAVVAVGNGKGQVGVGVGKAAEVIGAIQKGVSDAKKSLITVPMVGTTVPHPVIGRQGSSRIMIKPAIKGTGIIAGGAVRSVLELAGIGDVLAKCLGSRSPLNVARGTIDGLKQMRTFEESARLRGISIRQMLS